MANHRKTSWKAIAVTVTIVAMLVGLVGLDFASVLPTAAPRSVQATTRQLALSCTTDEATTFHIHPHLRIIIGGVEQAIPGNTGITPNCQHPIHTHKEDTDHTTIHIESPEQRDFTLGDFFAVWGKTFNQSQILDSQVDTLHGITMTVNGKPSSDYGNLILRDNDQIIIRYGQNFSVGNIQVQTSGGGTVNVQTLPVK